MAPSDEVGEFTASTGTGRTVTRRTTLLGVAGLAGGLAGCGGDSGSSPTQTATPTEGTSQTDTASPSPSPTVSPTESDPEPLVVEDFEEGALSEYFGATDEVSLTDDPVLSGEFSLMDGTNSWGDGSIGRTEGLEYSPRIGDTFHVGLYVRDYDRDNFPFWAGFHWAVAEEDGIVERTEGFEPENCYSLALDTRDSWTQNEHGDLNFSEVSSKGQWDSGSRKILEPFEREFPYGEWIDIEIDWRANGDLDITCYDESGDSFSAISATGIDEHESGGIGFRPGGSRGHVNYWDHVRITDRPP